MTHHSSLAKLPLALLLASSLLAAKADTFFSDTFGNGSTVNQTPTTNLSTTATSYQSAVGGAATASIAANALTLTFPSGSSILGEVMGLFTNSPMSLNVAGDTIAITVVFTNMQNILSGVDNANSSLNIGLFNSGGVPPLQGNTVLGSASLTGGSQTWIGYASRIFTNGNATIFTRPVQTSGKAQDQDLLFTGASSSQAFNNPAGTSLGSTAGTVTLAQGGAYTLYFSITLTGGNALQITNQLYSGSGMGGTLLFTQTKSATGGNYLTNSFNGFAVGWRNSSSSAQVSAMTISSITVSGNVTGGGTPTIDTEPVPVTVATGGSCPFSVVASGAGLTYQWHRNGTNLLNGGNISGTTTPTLVINSASAADVASGANGYYVTVTSVGSYSTNSITNSLTLVAPTNLVYSSTANGSWDVNVNPNWEDANGNTGLYFTYGDPVTFDDVGGGGTVTLNGSYLSAASVTVSNSTFYTFQGTGSFAGPGGLLYTGSAQLTINNANTYSGGTIISNASANLRYGNLGALGTGPVTLAGGQMEILTTANASTGNLGTFGDANIVDNFTIKVDGVGTFAAVFPGNLNGVTNKTLTFNPTDLSTTNRFRVYGTNTVCDANLVLNGPSTPQAMYYGTVLAPYGASGSQTYNGIISGNGGLVQRGTASTILNGQNTYSGGTFATAGGIAFGVDSVPTTGSVVSSPIGTGPLFVSPEVGSANGSGTVLAANGARTIANPIQYPTATNNQTLIIGGTNALTLTGSYALNGQDGSATAVNRTIQANNTNSVTTLSGVISDGGMACGLTKTGLGVLALNNTETYTGPTRISAGTLAVNGALNAASVVTVTNGLLGGSGTVNGAVTIQNGGGVAPGNSIGTLTINNNLTIQGGSTNRFEVNKTAGTKDLVVVNGNATYNGTLSVTNLSGTITTADTFQIFNVSGTKTTTFTNIIGSPGAGMAWSFTPSTGILGVVATVATNPTNITATVTGNTLSLSWPADHLGWSLQIQTNTLNVGLVTNAASWVTLPGSSLVTATNMTINPANGTVFYRMIY